MAALPFFPILPVAYQQTRFQITIAEAGDRLRDWATNPWRRLSLLLVTLLISFVIGIGLGSISGVLGLMDIAAAVLCVVVVELSIRGRRSLRGRDGDQLTLRLVDMARMGLLYGLLLDGFKLL
ncbi:MAG: DUF565 domain-containing protein [Cyanobacteriota bacterium]|jgi:hypothetical protein